MIPEPGAAIGAGLTMTTQAPEQTAQRRDAASPSSLSERLDIITRLTRRLFRVPVALLSLMNESKLRLFAGQGVPSSVLGTEVAFDAATVLNDGPLVIPDVLGDSRFVDHPWVSGRLQVRFYAGTLVLAPDGAIAGVLSVCDRSPNALAEGDLILLRDLARLVESELKLVSLGRAQAALVQESEALRRRSLVDTRTQLWNRHAMFELLDREFHRARREREAVAVILGEIDGFEAVANAHGPAAGDAVLMEVTNRIRGVVRRSDTVARFGPDEFLVFLGRCDLENATALAERMRHRIRKAPIVAGMKQVNVTMTFGVAASDDSADWTPDTLVRRADEALAEAVKGGRDKVATRKL
jgi:diguanylate cyclase (GGDEF)-like protein